jgi:hypothetical protein
MKTGCRSASAASCRKRSSPRWSGSGGAQPRGFDTNTWTVSQPSLPALATVLARPPAAETWEPMRTLAR